MALRTPLLAGVAVLGILAAGWLYRDNQKLEDEVARLRNREQHRPDPWSGAAPAVAAKDPERGGGGLPFRNLLGSKPSSEPAPRLGEAPKESRLDRRLRRQGELAALLGRDADETDEEYRSRMLPFLKMALDKPRANVDDMRKQAEEAAKVSEAQHQQLDAAFDEVYTELLDYTNGAITDGQLTPYDRNVKGILQYAGGLGAILESAEGRVGKILTPEQVRTMYETGFEWGEYLGVRAPWENLRPPPPRPGS